MRDGAYRRHVPRRVPDEDRAAPDGAGFGRAAVDGVPADLRGGADTDGDGHPDTLLTADGPDLLVLSDLDGDGLADRVLRIGPDGAVHGVAGTGTPGTGGRARGRGTRRTGRPRARRRGARPRHRHRQCTGSPFVGRAARPPLRPVACRWPALVRPVPPDGPDEGRIDPTFRALPLHRLADAALSIARSSGRRRRRRPRRAGRVSQSVELRDGGVTSVVDATTVGLAVRVLVDGTWGFASHVELTPDRAAATAERAVGVARALAPLARERVERAAEPVHAATESVLRRTRSTRWPCRPARRSRCWPSGRAGCSAAGVDHVRAGVTAVRENKFYADLAGTSTLQQRVRVEPTLTGDRRRPRPTGRSSRWRPSPRPSARGWEYLTGTGLGLGRRAGPPPRVAGREGRGALGRAPAATTW